MQINLIIDCKRIKTILIIGFVVYIIFTGRENIKHLSKKIYEIRVLASFFSSSSWNHHLDIWDRTIARLLLVLL